MGIHIAHLDVFYFTRRTGHSLALSFPGIGPQPTAYDDEAG
jgi:hypothetical protein